MIYSSNSDKEFVSLRTSVVLSHVASEDISADSNEKLREYSDRPRYACLSARLFTKRI
jgi:hypothetical protein